MHTLYNEHTHTQMNTSTLFLTAHRRAIDCHACDYRRFHCNENSGFCACEFEINEVH